MRRIVPACGHDWSGKLLEVDGDLAAARHVDDRQRSIAGACSHRPLVIGTDAVGQQRAVGIGFEQPSQLP